MMFLLEGVQRRKVTKLSNRCILVKPNCNMPFFVRDSSIMLVTMSLHSSLRCFSLSGILIAFIIPISLCNFIYKVASIGCPFGSCVCLITDNALIAMELFHSMKQRSNRRRRSIAMKLDMSKPM